MTHENRSPGGKRRKSDGGLVRLSFAVIAFMTASLFFTGEALSDSKHYDHPEIGIVFRLQPDGSAVVEETRAYRFTGSFSWAQFVKSTEGEYGRYGIEFTGVRDADTGDSLPFEQNQGPGSEILKWHYSAKNETKRFLILYRISGAVQRYEDAAQFYWKAVEDEHEKALKVDLEIIPPAPGGALFKVFVHSDAEPGTIEIAEDRSRAIVSQAFVGRNSFVELRVLLDPSLFPGTALSVGESHASLLEDERLATEAWRRSEERRVELASRRSRGLKIALAAGLGLVVVFALYYKWYFEKYGREYRVEYVNIYERRPPGPIPPSVLPAIMTQRGVQITEMSKSFTAALLDCARLGYLEISEKEEKSLFIRKKVLNYELTGRGRSLLEGHETPGERGDRPLTDFEKDVLDVVFREAGDGASVSGTEIEKWAAGTRGRKTQYLLFMEPRAGELRKGFEKDHFPIDDPVSERARNHFVILTVVTAPLATVIIFSLTRHPLSFVFGGLILIGGLILSLPLARRTREACLEHKRWTAFAKFMSDFSAMKEAGPSLLSMWEEYLVYAAALGVADKLLSNLKLFAREYGTPIPTPLWFHPLTAAGAGALSTDAIDSIESLNRSISNLQSLSSALSTSSSTGGGFSGGGSGGGGGGGGSSSAG